jgi:AAA domain
MTTAVPGLNLTPPPDPTTRLAKADSVLESLRARITTAQEIEFLKIVVYCRPGIGKTWFAASAPNPCGYDVDGTIVSLEKHPEYRKIPWIPYKSPYQGEMVLAKVASGDLWPEKESFIFDSATVFQNKSLKEQLRTSLGLKEGSNEMESMLTRYLTGDTNWIANTNYMEDVVARLDKIKNKHVIVTAHIKTEKDDSTGVTRQLIRPDITMKAYQSFARWANIIGFMDVVGEKRTMRILPSPSIDAKSHIGGPAVIENPTFQSLLNIKETGKP